MNDMEHLKRTQDIKIEFNLFQDMIGTTNIGLYMVFAH